MARLSIIFTSLLMLGGCNSQALYSELSEKQVNEMVAVLQVAGLPAEKKDLGKGLFSVNISNRYFADAVEHLRTNGYPRDEFDSLGNVFKKEGFVSSPLEEHARLIYALSQEISDTITSIDGVIMARVHLAVPEQNPLSETVKSSSASVFIKHRREVDLSGSLSQIKSLVVNGIEGLPYENVTVAMFATEPMLKSVPKNTDKFQARPILTNAEMMVGGGISVLLVVVIGIWMLMRRKKQKTASLVLTGENSERG